MEFIIREISKDYLDVQVKEGASVLDVGVLDVGEAINLKCILREAVYDLDDFIHKKAAE